MADPNALAPAPTRQQLVNADGNMTPTWTQWLQKLVDRVGGLYSTGVGALSDQLSALASRVTSNESSFNQQMSALEGRMAGLETRVSALESEMAAIQTLLDSGFTGTIVTAMLTTTGAQGSMTFSRGVLVSQQPAT